MVERKRAVYNEQEIDNEEVDVQDVQGHVIQKRSQTQRLFVCSVICVKPETT